MMEEGKRLRAYGENVVVKVPMTPDGLKACKSFSSQGIPVNVTLIFSANQAYLLQNLEQNMLVHLLED